MILPSDPQGFLIGQKLELNIEETKRVVEAVNELKGELSEIKRLLAAGQRQSRQGGRRANGGPTPTPNPAGGPRGPRPRPVPNNANPPVPPQNPRPTPRRGAGGRFEGNNPNPVPPNGGPRPDQRRGSNGRFERLSPEEQARRAELQAQRQADRESRERAAQSADLARNIGAALEGGERLDPVISALNELGGFLKPLKSIGAATLNATRSVARRVGGLPSAIKGAFLTTIIALLGAYAAVSGGGSKRDSSTGEAWQDKVKNAFGIKTTGTTAMDAGDVGAISARFESGGNAGAINPDPANQSTNYGMYQFNAKTGGLAKFLEGANPAAIGKLASLTPETPEFNAEWRRLAANPEFGLEQTRAAKKQFLEPLLPSAAKAGLDITNPAIRAALFSGSIQHGPKGNRMIYQGMGDVSGLSIEDQLARFYGSRSAYVANLPKSNKWTAQNVAHEQARYAKELPRAIAASRAAKVAPVKTTQPSMPSTPTPVESVPVKAKTDNTQSSSVIQPLTQNLTDRSLAQIATGGIGQGNRSYWS